MISAMGIMKTTTIDGGGAITIPQELLEEAGFKPGMQLHVTAHDGHIEIDPATSRVRLEKRGRLTVLVPIEPIEGKPPDIDEIIEELREERMNEILGRDPAAENDRRR